jgi:DNA-binding transcriptional LysR family regulator
MSVSLEDMRVLAAVAEHGSFGRAAIELLVSQPAVSERIRHLERAVGMQLFERTTRGAVLTPAGEQLLPYAQRCLALADEAVEATRRVDGHRALTVAVHSTFAPRVVPMVLGALGATPCRVTVRDAHSHEVAALVDDGVADLGFVVPGPARRGLRRIGLAPDPIVCVVAPDHPLARLRRPTVKSLREALVALNPWGEGHEEALDAFAAGGIEPWRIRRCGDAATAASLARDHDHVAFVTHSTVERELASGALREVALRTTTRWDVQVELLFRATDRDDPVIAPLVDAIVAA